MPDAQPNRTLNEILIQAYRSLLQYTIESWPWTDADGSAEQQAIDEMASEQKAAVAEIAELLDRRQITVDFGTYPDWSELHFVSLDYFLKKLIDDESQLIAAIEREQPGLRGDAEASAVIANLLAGERRRLERLRGMAAARKVSVSC
ncbi:MAG TPA: hypothetical protein VL475_05985 [Planctomycetaceae bacterium]|nr:hypothetical protein [Planctomycetaceae bacterium]